MILDDLSNSEKYYNFHPCFKKAFDFLKSQNLKTLDLGKYEIDGKNIYAIVSKADGLGRKNTKLEVHRRYIDIQVILDGIDCIGYMPLIRCLNTLSGYDSDKDCEFFSDLPEKWALINPGQFIIFFTDDAHAPLGGEGVIHKIAIKIAI